MLRRTAIVILAAGGSRRLGQPKQLLRVLGEPLLRRVVRMAAEVQPGPFDRGARKQRI